MNSLFILYVKDQERSRSFYSSVLNKEPILDVPGMTEFDLSQEGSLGLMPESGIEQLLGPALPDPSRENGIPRAELYLHVDSAAIYHSRALQNGARELSPLEERGWGDRVAYSLDPDGHVLAFAEKVQESTR
jgi:catechol 2,3-dioxygenase-like lactoylglutathione lyase family enzyme